MSTQPGAVRSQNELDLLHPAHTVHRYVRGFRNLADAISIVCLHTLIFIFIPLYRFALYLQKPLTLCVFFSSSYHVRVLLSRMRSVVSIIISETCFFPLHMQTSHTSISIIIPWQTPGPGGRERERESAISAHSRM